MTESELEKILLHLSAAIDIYRNYKGTLTAADISLKSMLNVARLQVSDELAGVRMKARKPGG
ncbi:MAG: hypothetical protein JWM88_3503 [Verrucomicrobia bacterium]|nr:hypothetical protein [Verrucomicrobiota bacterium]